MAQVAVGLAPLKPLPPARARKNSFHSSGRGGSGNIRRLNTSADTPDLPALPSREAQSTLNPDKSHFTSSGRGGAGNVRPSTSNLEAHPLTASILSEHSTTQAKYEQRIRNLHAEVNVVRSSGRGGSGNISDSRRRSRSQEPRTVPKKRFFTTKGREKDAAQAHDGQDRSGMDHRISCTTCSSGSSRPMDTRHSQESRASNAMTSSSDAVTDPSLIEDETASYARKRYSFLTRWSKSSLSMSHVTTPASSCPPLPTTPTPPGTSIFGLDLRAPSWASIVPEDREYVSFLEM